MYSKQEVHNMDSMEKVSALLEKRAKIALGGGDDKQQKQRQGGALTARERIAAFLDEGSFIELDTFVSARNRETASDGVVTGYGTADGRLVYVYSQDVTVLGGAIGEMNVKKITKVFDLALKMGAPIVGMIDSNGARLEEGIFAQQAAGELINAAAKASGVVPNISIVFGNCAGGSAVFASMSDFVIMNEKNGRLFVTGPEVVEASTGKKLDAGAKANVNENGSAHLIGADDMQCIEKARLLLTYLPSNNLSDAFAFETGDDLNRTSEQLRDIDSVSDVRAVIAEIADDKAFYEMQEGYAEAIVTGFIRLNGAAVGAVACAGDVLDGRACEKAARFARFCDCFNIPVLSITDTDGFKVSADEEIWGLARKSARMAYAFSEATVPKVNVIIGKSYTTAGVIMNCGGADIVFAYPSAQIAPLAPGAGVGMLYADRLKKGENRDALCAEYAEKDASVYNAAAAGYVDDVIDPAETRQRVIGAFEMLSGKRAESSPRKHDNMPL